MKLSVFERLILLGLLPTEGDYLTGKTIRQAKELLAFNEDAAEFGVVQDGENIRCPDFQAEKDIDLPALATATIVKVLSDLQKNGKLDFAKHLTLYEKFIGE